MIYDLFQYKKINLYKKTFKHRIVHIYTPENGRQCHCAQFSHCGERVSFPLLDVIGLVCCGGEELIGAYGFS